MSDELLELAERCEAASGPNYALEVEIFKAMHPEYAGYVEGRGGLIHPQDGSDMRVLSNVLPRAYTASLDAAMTLVPEGADWMLDNFDGPVGKRCTAEVFAKAGIGKDGFGTCFAASPALAFTAACLRARASHLRMEVE